MTDHLFVYGTLMRGTGHAMSRWLAQHAEFIGEATFNGRLYRISTYPGVIASSDPGDQVFGEVFRLRRLDEVLPELDRYEACGADFPEPTEYVREEKTVQLARRASLLAWIYLYNWEIDEGSRIPSGRFQAPSAG